MKIALISNFCGGKTYLTNKLLMLNPDFKALQFAYWVKKIAYNLFNMGEKNRKLLQSIGENMREINPDVFLTQTLKESMKYKFVIIEDARYKNEILTLKKNGFKLIKIKISKELQQKRAKKLYTNALDHLKNRNHPSEKQLQTLEDTIFDLIIEAKDNDEPWNKLKLFYNSLLENHSYTTKDHSL